MLPESHLRCRADVQIYADVLEQLDVQRRDDVSGDGNVPCPNVRRVSDVWRICDMRRRSVCP